MRYGLQSQKHSRRARSRRKKTWHGAIPSSAEVVLARTISLPPKNPIQRAVHAASPGCRLSGAPALLPNRTDNGQHCRRHSPNFQVGLGPKSAARRRPFCCVAPFGRNSSRFPAPPRRSYRHPHPTNNRARGSRHRRHSDPCPSRRAAHSCSTATAERLGVGRILVGPVIRAGAWPARTGRRQRVLLELAWIGDIFRRRILPRTEMLWARKRSQAKCLRRGSLCAPHVGIPSYQAKRAEARPVSVGSTEYGYPGDRQGTPRHAGGCHAVPHICFYVVCAGYPGKCSQHGLHKRGLFHMRWSAGLHQWELYLQRRAYHRGKGRNPAGAAHEHCDQ